jgi:hypothetical protein
MDWVSSRQLDHWSVLIDAVLRLLSAELKLGRHND